MPIVMPRLTAAIAAAALAVAATAAEWPRLDVPGAPREGYSGGRDSVEARLGAMPLGVLEGVWQFAAGGPTVAIVPSQGAQQAPMEVVVVESADRSLRPGTVVGAIDYAGERDVYRATFVADVDHGRGLKTASTRQFVLRLDNDGAFLKFEPRQKGYRVNLWRLLPFMFSRLVSPRHGRGQNVDGCTRVFPEPDPPIEPRYL